MRFRRCSNIDELPLPHWGLVGSRGSGSDQHLYVWNVLHYSSGNLGTSYYVYDV